MGLLTVKILGAIGGVLVLIAGFVGSAPWVRLKPAPGATLNAAELTGVLKVVKSYMSWALVLFGVGGIFILAAFIVFVNL